uniref:Leishmanolysin-like peptidase n=8 Tax=Cercopithecidae TaxID=9527 RepID=A0A2K5UX14_MACFA
MDVIAALIFCRELPAGDAVQSESTFPPAGASVCPERRGRGRRGRRGVTRSMVTTLGPKMAAEWGGGAGYSGSGPGRSRWRWSGSMWVRSVLLLLGGLRASATSTPVSLGSSPPCRHHVPSDTEVINKVHLKANHVVKRDVDEHLRIKTVYDKSVEELLPEKKNLVKNKLFPQAISYLEKTFQVRRPAGTILLSRQCATNQYLRKENDPHRYCTGECAAHTRCGPVVVPEEHLQQCRVYRGGKWPHRAVGVPDQEGISDADFVLYVGALATERCSQENIISYAAYCQQEADMDRPIAGYANLCPNMISTQPQEFIGMLSTVKHEVIHALGFSAGLFAFYHDKDGNPLTSRFADGLPPFNYSLGLYQWSDKVVRKVERLWDVRDNKIVRHTVYLLVTPRVVEEARKHFDCPVLEGMELENQGGMGTELNHWEKRLLENEAMTGSHTQNRVLSRITLALMEDTGWYKANYSMAEKLDWGRGMGCDFVRKSCKFWIDQQRQKRQTLSPYCDTLRSNPLQLTCRQDQRAVAVCNLQKFPKPLPQEYQYFDELSGIPAEDLPYYGGSVEIADYCPFSQEFSWHLSGEYQRSSDCRILENQPEIFKNYGAEKYGPHSVCLIQKSAFVMEKCERKLSYPDWGSGCYQVSCSPQGLKVWVQDTSYLCSRAGQVLPISIQMNGWIHDGNLLCPSCWDFCELCPPETDPPATNLTRALPLDLCSCSSSLVVTLWLLLGNLFPLLAGFLLCVWH